MKLNYTMYHADNPETVVICHGLLGSGRNWGYIAKSLQPYRVICLDLRNHGASPHDPDMHYESLAQDIIDTVPGPVRAIMGHSMGGKVALQLGYTNPDYAKQLIIVDIVPKTYPLGRHDALINACLNLPLDTIKTRSDATAGLSAITDPAMRAFLLQNLTLNPTRWRVPLAQLQANDSLIMGMPEWHHQLSVPTTFIYGTESDYMTQADYPIIRERVASPVFIAMPGSHWLHAQHPDVFCQHVITCLDS